MVVPLDGSSLIFRETKYQIMSLAADSGRNIAVNRFTSIGKIRHGTSAARAQAVLRAFEKRFLLNLGALPIWQLRFQKG